MLCELAAAMLHVIEQISEGKPVQLSGIISHSLGPRE